MTLALDHLRLIRSAPYRVRTAKRVAAYAAAHRGALAWIDVLHEDDGSCCRREPWATTSARLFGAALGLPERRARDLAAVIAEHEPNAVPYAKKAKRE